MRILWLTLPALLLTAPVFAERVVFELRRGASIPSSSHGDPSRFDEGLSPAPATVDRAGTPRRWRLDRSRVFVIDLPDSAAALAALAELTADPRVAWAERDEPREACVWFGVRTAEPVPISGIPPATSPDPLLDDGRQWGLDNRGALGPYGGTPHADIHARDAWVLSRGDSNVVLAVADTGVDPWHPDLAVMPADGPPRLIDGFDATLVPGEPFDDSLGHGTQVAGVMAARSGDGAHFDSLGIAGVCGGDGGVNPGCRLMPIRICVGHSGVAYTIDLARGLAWAVDHGARVVNLSFAATSPSMLERHAILDAVSRGVLVVCAAGNRALDRPGLPMYPAALAGDGLCMSVGASDAWDRRAAWSSYGAWLDLVAPGVDIWSTALTYPSVFVPTPPRYAANSGTSFAAPFASGVAGLMLARRPELDAADLAPLMRANADDIEAPGPDSLTGAGRLDAWGALADVGPDRAIVHGTVTPRVSAVTHDTLTLAEAGQPLMDALGRRAAVSRVSMRATVPVPDSLLAPARAWTRVAGSSTLREASRLAWLAPWAEVAALTADSLTLHGTLYRIEDARIASLGAIDTMTRWLSVPPESARIAYTIWGRFRPAPCAAGPPANTHRVPMALVASPNPFVTRTRLAGSPGATVELFDTTGRRVRTLRLDARGEATWDGRDGSGRALPAGIFLARGSDGAGGRFVRIE